MTNETPESMEDILADIRNLITTPALDAKKGEEKKAANEGNEEDIFEGVEDKKGKTGDRKEVKAPEIEKDTPGAEEKKEEAEKKEEDDEEEVIVLTEMVTGDGKVVDLSKKTPEEIAELRKNSAAPNNPQELLEKLDKVVGNSTNSTTKQDNNENGDNKMAEDKKKEEKPAEQSAVKSAEAKDEKKAEAPAKDAPAADKPAEKPVEKSTEKPAAKK